MADTSGMVLHERRFSRDFYAPNETGVHAAYIDGNGYFIRWQFKTGDSMINDGSFAELCNMEQIDYLNLMCEKYNGHYSCGLYFDKREDCQRAIDEVIQPVVLLDELGGKQNETA